MAHPVTAGDSKSKDQTQAPINTFHDIVLDYLHTQAYPSTARVLSGPRPWKRATASALGSSSSGDSTGVNSAIAEELGNGNGHGSGSGAGSGTGNGNGAIGPIGSGSGSTLAIGTERGMAVGAEREDLGMDIDGSIYGNGNGLVGLSAVATMGAGEDDEMEGGIVGPGRLVAMERRRAILNFILNGAIMRAVDSLNNWFPAVLTDPPTPVPTVPTSSLSATATPYTSTSTPARDFSSIPRHATPPGAPMMTAYSRPPLDIRREREREQERLAPVLTIPPPPLTSPSPSPPKAVSPPPSSSPSHAIPTFQTSYLPSHVRLNLQIQAFIESFRQMAPPSVPSSPSSSLGSLSSSLHLPSSSGVTLTNALTAAQGLHQEAKKLNPADRAIYLQEIKDVGALFAYTDPESSILGGFLKQGRRIALAEQINRAILHAESHPTRSKLERTARGVSALYSYMSERKIDTTPTWTAADGPAKEELAVYLRNLPKRGFALKDFIGNFST
ncbi:uncharacterized protein MKK02DRAFT_40077 [Dioszegia hungarica]|uniref:CRA domain-containing protein n=1 Tax=Dioszegia hungarica TaxID=4972 RepID=A0AA38HGL2_9TREE|nr:uncharacterized protein MKK02DRAFT_40077 [Dioszegia hungarica]KAI9639753.1 hypothetical protein MKK02DRAFT_40077 [Dioszegia hungarica]